MKDEIITAGTLGVVLLHFITCGLPLIAAMVGATMGMPLSGVLGHTGMLYLLIISGIMIIISFITYLKGCGCGQRARRIQKACLIIACAMYATALAGHFVGTGAPEGAETGETLCH
jgi:hypothetical protein